MPDQIVQYRTTQHTCMQCSQGMVREAERRTGISALRGSRHLRHPNAAFFGGWKRNCSPHGLPPV